MSKTTLADLFVDTMGKQRAQLPYGTKPATTQDLIEAVESIGGKVRETTQSPRLANPWIPVLEPGRYLVLRIEEDE